MEGAGQVAILESGKTAITRDFLHAVLFTESSTNSNSKDEH